MSSVIDSIWSAVKSSVQGFPTHGFPLPAYRENEDARKAYDSFMDAAARALGDEVTAETRLGGPLCDVTAAFEQQGFRNGFLCGMIFVEELRGEEKKT